MTVIVEMIVAAISGLIFVLSTGTVYGRRHGGNIWLKIVVGLVCITSTILLIVQIASPLIKSRTDKTQPPPTVQEKRPVAEPQDPSREDRFRGLSRTKFVAMGGADFIPDLQFYIGEDAENFIIRVVSVNAWHPNIDIDVDQDRNEDRALDIHCETIAHGMEVLGGVCGFAVNTRNPRLAFEAETYETRLERWTSEIIYVFPKRMLSLSGADVRLKFAAENHLTGQRHGGLVYDYEFVQPLPSIGLEEWRDEYWQKTPVTGD